MNKRLTVFLLPILIIGLIAGLSFGPWASATVPGTNTLVSVNNTGNGQGGNGNSYLNSNLNNPIVSGDGRSVVFVSAASDLVSGDTNANNDIFVRDLTNGTTTRVNVSTSGVQSNGTITINNRPAISSTGRYILFSTNATNLIDGQTLPGNLQLYMRDMKTSETKLLTQTNTGVVGAVTGCSSLGCGTAVARGVSSDGRFVIFTSTYDNFGVTPAPGPGHSGLYRLDRSNQTFESVLPSLTNGMNYASMSCDGALIAFDSYDQLTAADTDSERDIYLVDFRKGYKLSIVSAPSASTNTLPNSYGELSCNGNYIAFQSADYIFTPSLIATSNTTKHAYVYDRVQDIYTLVDQSSGGTVSDLGVNGTDIISVDNDGNTIFTSNSTNLQSGYSSVTKTQAWFRNHRNGTTEIISKNSGGTMADNNIDNPSISADGKVTTYNTTATNLISSDTNGKVDVFTSLTGL